VRLQLNYLLKSRTIITIEKKTRNILINIPTDIIILYLKSLEILPCTVRDISILRAFTMLEHYLCS